MPLNTVILSSTNNKRGMKTMFSHADVCLWLHKGPVVYSIKCQFSSIDFQLTPENLTQGLSHPATGGMLSSQKKQKIKNETNEQKKKIRENTSKLKQIYK